MSTKIYNGFKVEASSMEDLLILCGNFRPWLEAAQLELYEKFCARINKQKWIEDKGHPDYYSGAFNQWNVQRKTMKKTEYRDPPVDTDFNITFLPYGGKIYGIAYTEHRSWFEEWLKQPGVSEFGYWNNTDRPHRVSHLDWGQRGVLWDSILAPSGIPGMNGFSVTVADPGGPNIYKHAEQIRNGTGERNRTPDARCWKPPLCH